MGQHSKSLVRWVSAKGSRDFITCLSGLEVLLEYTLYATMTEAKETSEDSPSVDNSLTVDDASPKPIPDGGLLAWLQVAGSFCLYFCTWGKLTWPPLDKIEAN